MNTICGIVRRDGDPVAGLGAVLAALPGPAADATATWAEGPAGLAWRGEAAAGDGSAARGPVVDRDAGLAATVSARLDDRDALCEALDVPRPARAAATDAALVLRAHRRWGADCADRLLGDYAFAVWDARRRTLFCARDHVGACPFYYALTTERIVFASDVGAVLAAPGVADDLDEAVVATHLTRRWRGVGARTFFRGVRRLLPGHLLVVEAGAARTERWWRPENAPEAAPGDDDSLAEAFLAIYERAVGDRLRGHHRVGVHVSGGLDSSSIAVLAARALGRAGRPAPAAFSWQPAPGAAAGEGADADEHRLIAAVVRGAGGLPLHHCAPTAGDLVAHLRADVTRDLEVHPNEVPVRRRAADVGVRVLLSGWGGDEGISFNGRGFYQQLLLSGRFGALWRELAEQGPHPFASILVNAALPLVSPKSARALRALRRGAWWRARDRSFVLPAFARRVRALPETALPRAGVRRVQLDLLARGHLGLRMEGWAVGGARRGIEYRYPLLDRRVIELALGLPPAQFRRGRWSRWVMRRAAARLLPPEVCWYRSKQDPVRLEGYRSAFCAALPALRELVEHRSAASCRGGYLDMPRLLQWLDADRFRAHWRGGSGPIYHALRFLDF